MLGVVGIDVDDLHGLPAITPRYVRVVRDTDSRSDPTHEVSVQWSGTKSGCQPFFHVHEPVWPVTPDTATFSAVFDPLHGSILTHSIFEGLLEADPTNSRCQFPWPQFGINRPQRVAVRGELEGRGLFLCGLFLQIRH